MSVDVLDSPLAVMAPAPSRALHDPGPQRPPAVAQQYLAFRLGQEEYGLDILRVQEIRGYVEPTRIAAAPAFLKGVINLRGTIVPVIDLRIRFGIADPRYDTVTVTIVLNIGSRVVGVVVDSVSDVLQVDAARVQPAPDFDSAAIDTRHITGIATLKSGTEDRMLILLDIERLLSGTEVGLLQSTSPLSSQPR